MEDEEEGWDDERGGGNGGRRKVNGKRIMRRQGKLGMMKVEGRGRVRG